MKNKLEEKKNELAKKYSDPNNLRHCAVTTPEEDEFTAFATGFDAGISAYKEMLEGEVRALVINKIDNDGSFKSYNVVTKSEYDEALAKIQQQAEKIESLENDLKTKAENGCCIVEHGWRMEAEHRVKQLESLLKEAESVIENIAAKFQGNTAEKLRHIANQYMEKVK